MAINIERKEECLVDSLLRWFSQNARDLPWRRTRDPYAIWVSEIMLQQTQVKTVIPFWERWMRELPTIEALASASSDKIHKLWEGLGYYTRVRNMQKAAQLICSGRGNEALNKIRNPKSEIRTKSESPHVLSCRFPENFDDVLALPGIGRYTAGAICSISFNQPTPILDGNVIRVLTRVFGIAKNPREQETNAKLWNLAQELVSQARKVAQASRLPGKRFSASKEKLTPTVMRAGGPPALLSRSRSNSCSFLNQSLMELGALICTPRNPRCAECPVKKLCAAFQTNRVEELPNLSPRTPSISRRFAAFICENNGQFLVRQRPAGVVNAHLWEFPNIELNSETDLRAVAKTVLEFTPKKLQPLCSIRHSITRYRITLEAHRAFPPIQRFNVPTAGLKFPNCTNSPSRARTKKFSLHWKSLTPGPARVVKNLPTTLHCLSFPHPPSFYCRDEREILEPTVA